ncbi:MAG: hypothetical protein IT385_13555 [Deltaproteobacteria bacterium]|nr:hypothetical protein [Deltaproteobacteria bacterium]
MVPDSPPTNDPLAELARELGAPPPAGLAVLDAERLRELLATLRAARAHEAEALAAATEAALGHVPWVLRGLVRKALGDEPR